MLALVPAVEAEAQNAVTNIDARILETDHEAGVGSVNETTLIAVIGILHHDTTGAGVQATGDSGIEISVMQIANEQSQYFTHRQWQTGRQTINA